MIRLTPIRDVADNPITKINELIEIVNLQNGMIEMLKEDFDDLNKEVTKLLTEFVLSNRNNKEHGSNSDKYIKKI